MPVVIVQNWEERERGWGSRPDGFTVSLTVADAEAHRTWYNATYNSATAVPDEYTIPDGAPFPVDTDDATYAALAAVTPAVGRSRTVDGVGSFWSRGRALTHADLRLPQPPPQVAARSKSGAATPHPMQPVVMDDHGTIRFKVNAIVQYMLAYGNIDLNKIATLSFTTEDRMQFAQLIGYSVGGYSELSYVTQKSAAQAARRAHAALAKTKTKSGRSRGKA